MLSELRTRLRTRERGCVVQCLLLISSAAYGCTFPSASELAEDQGPWAGEIAPQADESPSGQASHEGLWVPDGTERHDVQRSPVLFDTTLDGGLPAVPIVVTPNTTLSIGLGGPVNGNTGDKFGGAIDIKGDLAVVGARQADVGANQDQGAAYVMGRSGEDWRVLCKLVGQDSKAGDGFGASVAQVRDATGAGSTIVVGAPSHTAGATRSGAAYVFRFNPTTLSCSQSAKLQSPGSTSFERFGNSVAITSGVVAVGAPFRDVSAITDAGSVFMFEGSGSSWSQAKQLVAYTLKASAMFGHDVAIAGSNIVVGVPYDGATANGSVQVFRRTGAATYGLAVRLVASDGAASDRLGISVDANGSYIVAGAALDDGTYADQGSAYVFKQTSGVWQQKAKLVATAPMQGDTLGLSVAFSTDNRVVIGAPRRGVISSVTGAVMRQGAAYVFTRSNETWTQQVELRQGLGNLYPSLAEGDELGMAVAADPGSVMLGVPHLDTPNVDQGAVVYSAIPTSGNSWLGSWQSASERGTGGRFGSSIAVHGTEALASSDTGTYAYKYTTSGWVQTQKVTSSAFDPDLTMSSDRALIGASVYARQSDKWILDTTLPIPPVGPCRALHGNTIVIQGGAAANHALIVYSARSLGVWVEEARIARPEGGFGGACALDYDTLVVGASSYGTSPYYDGAAYVFERVGSTWSQTALLQGDQGAANYPTRFGSTVSINQDTIMVGAPTPMAPLGSGLPASQKQHVYAFERIDGVWTRVAKISGGTRYNSMFGSVVAVHGGTLAVLEYDPGCVSIFQRDSDGWSTTATEVICSPKKWAGEPRSFGTGLAFYLSRLLFATANAAAPELNQGSVHTYDIVPAP